MAETIPAEPLTTPPASPEQQFHEHRRTYAQAMHIAWVGTVFVLAIVASLAVGATSHRWVLAGFWMVIGAIAFAVSAGKPSMGARPGLVVLVLALLTLLLVNA